jgi:autotransporter-associated beta strand protein
LFRRHPGRVLCAWLPCVLLAICLPETRAGTEVWPSQYKIKPWETNRLTAADVVGPDGIVYPDWTGVGVEGGIPAIDLSSNPADGTILSIGGYSYRVCRVAGTDNTAVSTALSAATSYANGGSQRAVVYFPAGTYTLSQQFTISETGIVIAGAGKANSILKIGTGGTGALFNFAGTTWGGGVTANANILRGSSNATFSSVSGHSVGKWVRIVPTDASSPTDTMRARYSKPEIGVVFDNAWDHLGRVFMARITAINGTTVTFDRTFPHDLFTDENPQMRTATMVEYGGVQDLTIETTSGSYGLEPVRWYSVANCWLKGVRFNKADNWPIAASSETMIRCEIRDCNFDGTWADINSGSNAYLGWGNVAMDCLMENCTGKDLRHMAIFQKAMRCVVRSCAFSAATVRSPQLHGRFPLDNLIEGTTFSAGGEAYYTDPVHSLIHGPNGPRNVFYNNRVTAGRALLWIMGAQENLILAYNKVAQTDSSQQLPALWAFDRSFDGILRGNTLQVHANTPAIIFEDTTCPGWDVYDNRIYGSKGFLWAGDSSPVLTANNRYFAYGTPADPSPEAASIYLWQRTNANTARLVLVIQNRVVSENSGTLTARVVRVKASLGAAATVNLSADMGGVSIPSSVTIPAGAAYADFTVTGTPVSGGEKTVTLTASAAGLLSDTEPVFVLDEDVALPDFGQGQYPPAPVGLPAGWRSADFGDYTATGSAAYSATNDTWTVQGAGLGDFTLNRTLAQGGRRFTYRSILGNGEIRARLTSASGDYQVGLMIADDAAPATEFVRIESTGRVLSSGDQWDYHAELAEYASAGAKTVPIWLRLVRSNSLFTAYTSTDGVNWTQKASVDFYNDLGGGSGDYKSQSTLDDVMHFGLFVNSNLRATLATATFSNVTVIGTSVDTTPPSWVSGWPKADTATTNGFTARARIDEAGMAYFVVVNNGAPTPSAAQVKAGQDAGGTAALQSGSLALAADTEGSSAVSGLLAGTPYDVYFAAEDADENLQSGATKVDVTTLGTPDTNAPVWISGWPKADTAGSEGFTVRAQINEAGTGYYVVVSNNAAAPSVAQVKAGQDATGSAALKSGSLALAANLENSAVVTGLSAGTAYDVYCVAEDAVPNLQAAVTKVDVSTLADTTPPVWISGWPKADTATTNGFTVRAEINEAGTAYYVVLSDGAGAPSATEVKNGQGAGGGSPLVSGSMALSANTEGSSVVSTLAPETAYDVYVVAQDGATNLQGAPVLVNVSTASTNNIIAWDGDTSTAWATGANWVGGAAPVDDLTTSTAIFNLATYPNQPNAGNRSVKGMVVGGASAALTIATTSLTNGAGGLTVASGAGTVTVGAITLGADQSWVNDATALVTVNNNLSLGDYTLTMSGGGDFAHSGSGAISGAGVVILDEGFSGTLSLSRANSFSGGLRIESGTVVMSANDAPGSGTITLGGGGSADATLTSTISGTNQENPIETTGGGSGVLSVVKGDVNNNCNFTGPVTLGGPLTLKDEDGNPNYGLGFNGVISGSAVITVETVAGGSVTIGGNNDENNFTSPIEVVAGKLKGHATGLRKNNAIAIASGAELDLVNNNVTIAGLNDIEGGGGTVNNSGGSDKVLTLGGSGSYGFSGGMAPATSSRIALAVTNGTHTLTGTSTYTGATTVSGAGTLLVNGSLAATPVTVNSGATFGGTGGTGTNVTCNVGGQLKFFKTTGAPDTPLVVGGTLTLNSNLVTVEVLGAPLGNGTYTLCSAASISGSPNPTPTITGQGLGGGGSGVVSLASTNLLLTVSGVLGLPTQPTNLVYAVSNGVLTLSWPTNYTGWELEAQTNGLNAGLGTNWTVVPGSTATNRIDQPVDPANPAAFYRLHRP